MNGYIQNSLRDSNHKIFLNNINVYVLNPLPDGFDLDYVLTTVEEVVPEHLIYGLEGIYIGKFDDLEKNEFDALYKDCTIYATNNQKMRTT